MLMLLLGGAGSGKSACAEALLSKAARPRIYLATMEPYGVEAAARIERHRRMREDKGFVTVERFTDLAGLDLPVDCAVLLEDLGNLCANELFSPRGGGEDALRRGLDALCNACRDLIVVSNEVFLGGTDYAGETLRYLSVLSRTQRMLAARADVVCEVCCGIPVCYKGEL